MRRGNNKLLPLIVILLVFAGFSTFAQMRDDIYIYIPMPVGGSSEQQVYFLDNFTSETLAAGYAISDSAADSDYALNLNIKPNMIIYDDGTIELAPPEEKQFILTITLVETESDVDIVQFDFPFTTLPEMYEFNLYLIYQAMANVPLTKLISVEVPVEDDHWRNKWLYLRTSIDFNVPAYIPDKHEYHKYDTSTGHYSNFPINALVPFGPGATIGLELHFLNWMAAEADLAILLGNVNGIVHNYDIIGTLDINLKFPIKPAKHYMIEPFVGIAIPMAFLGGNIPHFGIQGGIQLGTKAGSNGAFFANFFGEYDLSTTRTLAPDDPPPTEINWRRFVIGVGVGYKIGFNNRNP